MREHVVAASKAMRHGEWKACSEFIVNKKMNTKVWDLFYEADRVRDMLVKFIKEESLRTYLFTYSNVYGSISVPYLSEMYDLPKLKVHSIISKMIINEELMASLDDPTDTVVMHRSEPSRLQALSMQLADKITNLVDANERIFEAKQPNFFQRNQGGYNRQNQGGNQGYRQQNFNSGKRPGGGQRRQGGQKNNYHQHQQQHQIAEDKLE
jgi:translation initiation factor 3 subunit C